MLLLTEAEAEEMIDDLSKLIYDKRDGRKMQHSHISDKEYKREIILAIYAEDNINDFSENVKKVILEKNWFF